MVAPDLFVSAVAVGTLPTLAMAVALGLALGIAIGILIGSRRADRKSCERRERERSAEQDERSAMMGTFGSGLAHELKTPLSTLEINLQLLLEEWKDPQTDRERRGFRRVESIQRASRKIDEILKAFVRFAKDPRPTLQPVALPPLIQEILETDFPEALSAAGRLGQIQISYQIDPGLPRVNADPTLLRQVLVNLLLNGVEAIEGEGRITVGAETRGSHVVLRVSDTGRGIPPELRDRIWDMYFTTKPSGIGMGLPIARRIVEAHGGKIEFESDGGTTFRVFLPVIRG
jgi:signal transduction histidine kinase